MVALLLFFDDLDHLLTDLADPFISLDLGHDLEANFTTDFQALFKLLFLNALTFGHLFE